MAIIGKGTTDGRKERRKRGEVVEVSPRPFRRELRRENGEARERERDRAREPGVLLPDWATTLETTMKRLPGRRACHNGRGKWLPPLIYFFYVADGIDPTAQAAFVHLFSSIPPKAGSDSLPTQRCLPRSAHAARLCPPRGGTTWCGPSTQLRECEPC